MGLKPAAYFTGVLFGSAAEGIRLRADRLPRVDVERTHETTCSEKPTDPPRPVEGYDDVLLFPTGYKAMNMQRSVIDFTSGFDTHEKRVLEGQLTRTGPYEYEKTTWSFNMHVTFYRCPGSQPCGNGKISPDAYKPPGA